MKKKISYFSRNEKMAARYRENLTPPEAKLWSHLSGTLKGYSFRAQEPVLDWIVDFYSPEMNLAVEVDGNWHKSSINRRRDVEKDRRLWEEGGILVLRIAARAIFHDIEGVICRIGSVIESIEILDANSPLLRYKAKTTKLIHYTPEEKAELIRKLEERGRIERKRFTPC